MKEKAKNRPLNQKKNTCITRTNKKTITKYKYVAILKLLKKTCDKKINN